MSGMTSQNTKDPWSTTKKITVRYVGHHEIKNYEEKGWFVVNNLSDCHHGRYSVIMKKLDKLQDN